MKVFLECYPCFLRQALDCAKISSDDPKIHKEAVDSVMKCLLSCDADSTPPQIAKGIYSELKRVTGNPDPYYEIRKEDNANMLAKYDEFKERVAEAKDGIRAALRLAVAGNILDDGTGSKEEHQEIGGIEFFLNQAPAEEEIQEIKDAFKKAKSLLYLGDNSGEIVADKILIEKLKEEYPSLDITFVVRGEPVINDIIMEDAFEVGITDLCEVIDNGDSSPGTDLSSCSEEFLEAYDRADMIISKGQGNYETLSGSKDSRIFYLLVAKCPVIARDLETEQGTMIIRRVKN